MDQGEKGWEAGIKTIAEEELRNEDAHPNPEELRAYQADELSGSEAARIQRHMALCHICADIVLEFAGVADQESNSSSSYAQLSSEKGDGLAAAGFPAGFGPRVGALVHSLRFAYGLSALFLAIAGAVLLSPLRDENPRANVRLTYLVPGQTQPTRSERGSPGGSPAVNSLQSSHDHLLVLGIAEARVFPQYRLEIISPAPSGGTTVWSTDQLAKQPAGYLTLDMPANFLPPGYYLLRVQGLVDGAAEAVTEYRLLVE